MGREKKMRRILLIIIMFLISMMFLGEALQAIPAFARKHRMSCKTCHQPFPRLQPFGEEFAENGFEIKDQEATRAYRDTGDDHLSLMRDFPFAVRMDGFISYNNNNSEKSDLGTPYNLKLLSGGTLGKNISYYFYFFFSEHGEVAGVEDAFITFNDVFETGIGVSLGQFQVSDPLFKRELRLTYEDYPIYKTRPGGSRIDLAYDRGIMVGFSIPGGGPDVVLEVLNGNGIGEADEEKNYDGDKYKNIFARVSQDIGEHFRVGAHYYYGKEAPDDVVNEVWMFGGDATVSVGDLEFNFQYMERNDGNSYFDAFDPTEIRTRGGLAEMVFTPGGPNGLWYMVGLYNWIDSDATALDYQSATFHVGYLLRRNIRLMSEFSYIFESHYGEHARAIVGVIAAF